MRVRRYVLPTVLSLALLVGLSVGSTASAASKEKAATAAKVQVVQQDTTSTTASAPYQRFIPGGIDPANKDHAWQQVLDRANVDPSYAKLIAREGGEAKFKPADYVPLGYTDAVIPGTTNSASMLAKAVAVKDHGGSESVEKLIVLNIKTHKRVHLMVRCANVRVHTMQPLPWKKFSQGAMVSFSRLVVKHINLACLTDKKFNTIKVKVKGFARGRTWGQVQGSMNAQVEVQVKAQVKVQISLHCRPAVPVVTPKTCLVAGTVLDAAGNCVAQSNTATAEQSCKAQGGSWNTQLVRCEITIIQINGNCSNITVVLGDGSVVSTSQAGNCNTNPPPPCGCKPPPPPPPPPPSNRPPTISLNNGPAHVFVNGTVQFCVTVFDPDVNDNLLVAFTVSAGSISAPSQTGSVRCAMFTAPANAVATVTFNATVTDGTSTVPLAPPWNFPVVADQF